MSEQSVYEIRDFDDLIGQIFMDIEERKKGAKNT